MFQKKWRVYWWLLLLGLIGGGLYFSTRPQLTEKKLPVATTMAQVGIFDRLGVPLAAVPSSDESLPERYAGLPQVGNHVSINFEAIMRINPSIVYVDQTLTSDYATKLKTSHIKMQSLDFSTYQAMQKSILQLGITYHKTAAAQELLSALKLPKKAAMRPVKVLLLIGMPGGSFLVANDQTYIGDLVKRAGGQIVGGDPTSQLSTPNPQTIAQENPDVVIRLAHAMPKQVKQSFEQTFQQAPYQTLAATQNGQVHDVTSPVFAMTANLEVVSAYEQIQAWLKAAE